MQEAPPAYSHKIRAMNSETPTNSKPLAEWQSIVDKDTLTLNQFMLLRTHKHDEESRKHMAPWFNTIAESLSEIQNTAGKLTRYVAEEELKLEQFERLEKSIAYQAERYELMKAQMPSEVVDCLGLNEKAEPAKAFDRKENDRDQINGQPGEKLRGKESKKEKPPAKPKTARKQSRLGSKKNTSAKTQQRNSSMNAEIPVISSVSEEELNEAPQYVKGRLTIAKIEGVVKNLNAIAAAKYNLLNRPYRDLNSSEITTYQDFHDNECAETKDKQFLTDNEIRGFGNFRLDATAKSVINILRHVGALKEVRGKNKSRIFIIN